MKRFLYILLFISIGPFGFSQLANTAHVQSLGGGVATGGNFKSLTVSGDPAASSELALGGNQAIYAGFMPGEYIILSFGLEKDAAVLAALYETLGGADWTTNEGWLVSEDIGSWAGVTVTNQRVSALLLPSNNLQHEVPELIKNLAKLEQIDFSDNQIRKLPDLSGMPHLGVLKVEENRLGFESLIKNKNIADYSYTPQKRYGVTKSDTVEAGQAYQLVAMVPGKGNVYQWLFDDFPAPDEAVDVSDANKTNLMLTDIDYSNMGSYRLKVTNPALPDLEIETRNQNIWAATDIYGKVFADDQGNLLTDGQVEIYRIFDGPFTLSDSSVIDSEGNYVIEDVVLGDFILLVKNNTQTFPNVLQTYYISNDDWLDADTLFLREQADDINIDMVFKPEVTPIPTGANFEGELFSELDETIVDEEDSRIDARRKVKRAACSMRRFVRSGRGISEDIYELYAYVESDDEGRFNFEGVEEGKYLLNIQYPGVPMDPNSDIEFIVGGDKENQRFTLTATITEQGIQVESREVLYSLKPYLKDIILYPNPTEGPLTIDFLVYRKLNDLKLEVSDVRGVKLVEQDLSPKMGPQTTRVDLTTCEAGVYFLVFTDAAGTFRQQVKIGRK
ncbi:T9SS type A sorting domain-containing protein [Marinoscillum sp.]|uniref:T9SS type A sorting domain-containing protein n=1 Tax=Marinoscillum sp. TaxID=2024838 RepID=UPI003BA8D3B6